jgi:integrase/recombinase XerD
MNNQESFSFKFIILPQSDGKTAKIFARITVDRKKAEFFTGHFVEINNWDQASQKSLSKKNSILEEDLTSIKNNIINIKRRLIYDEKPLSAKLIKDIYTGANEIKQFLLEYFLEHINQIEKLSKEYSLGTVSNYKTTYKHLVNFLGTRKLKDIPLSQVDSKFIHDFDFHLMTYINLVSKTTMDRNTANKQHQRLKAVIYKAIRSETLIKNPYQNFKLRNTRTNRDFLTDGEIKQMKDHSLGDNASLQKVRDIFLFSVYTGLRFGDAIELNTQHIKIDKNGKPWIEKVQGKTDEMLRIRMLIPAIEIMNKYDREERKITGFILPRISHQKVNAYLKVIAELSGIQKTLTHHIARHTFATTIALSNNVPLEMVSKMLGHTSVKATQIYAKITSKYLNEVTDRLDEKISGNF